MTYDRSRVMKDAHREWRATKHRPGASFSRCMKAAWAAERQRVNGRQFYNPAPNRTPPEVMRVFVAAGAQLRAMISI